MICILKLVPPISTIASVADLVSGWIIATDIDDARRQVSFISQGDLASELYTLPPFLSKGKHVLRTGHVMLVS